MRLRYACIPCAVIVIIFLEMSPRLYTFVCCEQTEVTEKYTAAQRINCPIKYRKNIKIQAPIPAPQCNALTLFTTAIKSRDNAFFTTCLQYSIKHCSAALELMPCHKL